MKLMQENRSWILAVVVLLAIAECNRDTKLDACERAVHHDAREVGYQCCVETCGGPRNVAGFVATVHMHECRCRSRSAEVIR
jgi:hypothetical protein